MVLIKWNLFLYIINFYWMLIGFIIPTVSKNSFIFCRNNSQNYYISTPFKCSSIQNIAPFLCSISVIVISIKTLNFMCQKWAKAFLVYVCFYRVTCMWHDLFVCVCVCCWWWWWWWLVLCAYNLWAEEFSQNSYCVLYCYNLIRI